MSSRTCRALDRTDVDTDQIIPSDWLKRVERTGFGAGLFSEWRDDREFVLNDPEFVGATVLVAGHNFGTGSSREHAVWALMDYGFEAVISSRFADIFRNNCTKQGLLPVQVSEELDRALLDAVAVDPSLEITIDVARGTVEAPAAGLAGTFRSTSSPASACSTGGTTSGSPYASRPTSRLTSTGDPPSCLRRDPLMVTFRPMEVADAPGAVAAFEGGLLTMLARHGLPVTGNSIQDERRRIDRTRHFLGTDPGGSWVAEDEGGAIIGVSQSFVRDDYWMLSQLGAVPGVQGQGIGRELLRLALSHGDPQSPGTIQCSARSEGDGALRRPRVPAASRRRGLGHHAARFGRPPRRCRAGRTRKGDRARAGHRDSSPPRRTGSARTVDVVAMLAHPGNHLLLHGDQAYAVAADDRIVTLGAHQEESAVLVLRAMLAEAPAGETIEINWLTSAQQWAIGEVVAAGIELQPFGPVMVRGMDGPPRPYIPSGGYG